MTNARGSPPLSQRGSRTARKKITDQRGPRSGSEIEAGVADLGQAVKNIGKLKGRHKLEELESVLVTDHRRGSKNITGFQKREVGQRRWTNMGVRCHASRRMSVN